MLFRIKGCQSGNQQGRSSQVAQPVNQPTGSTRSVWSTIQPPLLVNYFGFAREKGCLDATVCGKHQLNVLSSTQYRLRSFHHDLKNILGQHRHHHHHQHNPPPDPRPHNESNAMYAKAPSLVSCQAPRDSWPINFIVLIYHSAKYVLHLFSFPCCHQNRGFFKLMQ